MKRGFAKLIIMLAVACFGVLANGESGIGLGLDLGKGATVPLSSISRLIYTPLVRQATDYTCGVASAQSILGFHGIDIREDVLAKDMKADPAIGTLTKDIVAYFTSHGFTAEGSLNMTFAQLEASIDQNVPVIVLLQAWAEHLPVEWETDWVDGHYAVVTGYDDKNFYFMDPSTVGQYTYIAREEFLRRWHDVDGTERLMHYGLRITKDAPVFNFHDAVPMN